MQQLLEAVEDHIEPEQERRPSISPIAQRCRARAARVEIARFRSSAFQSPSGAGGSTRWVLGHKKLVAGLWIALAIAGVAAMGPAGKSFDEQVEIPGKEAFEANQRIAATYGSGGDVAPLVPVVSLPAGKTVDSPGVRGELDRALGRVADVLPGARIASYASTRDRTFVSRDGRTTFALVYVPAVGMEPGQAEARRAQAALAGVTVAGAPVEVTGLDALRAAAADGGEAGGASLAVEAAIAAGGALSAASTRAGGTTSTSSCCASRTASASTSGYGRSLPLDRRAPGRPSRRAVSRRRRAQPRTAAREVLLAVPRYIVLAVPPFRLRP